MRRIAFLIGLSCMLFAQFLDAQITTEEAPPIFDLYMSSLKGVNLNTSEQSLPSPDMKTIEMEDRANDGKRCGPLRFAYPVKVHYTLTNSGRWFDLKDGSKLWRLKVLMATAIFCSWAILLCSACLTQSSITSSAIAFIGCDYI